MANNRLYLICNVCGKHIMLAKDFLTGFGLRVTAEEIQDFLSEHTYCLNGDPDDDLPYSPGDFTLGYEFLDYCSDPQVKEV